MISLEALFCHVDDFCQQFEPQWQQHLLSRGVVQRQRERGLRTSEIMTVLIAFHQLGYNPRSLRSPLTYSCLRFNPNSH